MARTQRKLVTLILLAVGANVPNAVAGGPRMEGKYWTLEVESCKFHPYLEWNDRGSKGYYRPQQEGCVFLEIVLNYQNKGREEHVFCSFQLSVKTEGGAYAHPIGDINPISGPFVSRRYWNLVKGLPKDRFRQIRFIFEVPRRSNIFELNFQEFEKKPLTVDLKPLLPLTR